MEIHYLSDTAQMAPRLSNSAVPAKVRAGWAWHRLVPGFCAAGGMANYNRALVAPEGAVAFVSDRAIGPEADGLPVLTVNHDMVRLAVPFEQKDEAKRRGAKWISSHKVWACAPDSVANFKDWAGDEPLVFDILKPAFQQ